jgi:hypothetical protein
MWPRTWRRIVASILLAAALSACSPALNWRNVILGSLRFTLPCKPDQAERNVVLGGVSRTLDMRGCEADGALFAVSRIEVESAGEATVLVQAWRAAALAALQAVPATVADLTPPIYRGVPDANPQAWLRAQGRQPRGGDVQAQLGWLVVGREVFHLAVYAPHLVPAAVAPMMTDIDLPQ